MAATNTYSRVVAWVKVILPLLALALLSTLFLLSRTPDPNRAIPFAEVDVEELAREQRLGNPRIAGTLADGREVIFTADRAAPVVGNSDLIEAQQIEARLDLSPDSLLMVVAGNALFDLPGERADLGDDVHLTTSDGMHLRTDRLQFDLGASQVSSPGDVHVTGPGLDLTAGTMQASTVDGDNVVLFNNGVRVLYDPQN
ncbi:LPS export ABC transporter periplasmic protein LptC [Nioella nitratireducens]|uniref:LPS export ABC transporter periplasmic protein LptC n=1 Tax=Nioella nitratireducens TaxID=1287720 RepID=UPI0008FD2004|nr:LPS export ABC transporter periplasmic protein LptC [Nioella nitratireducens]